MYLLDSNICIAIINRNPQAIAEFNNKFSQCCVATIAIAELYKGVYCSGKIERNLNTLNEFLGTVKIVPFDSAAAEEFGKIQGELRRIGRPTGDLDALIAAVARSRGDTVVTHNIRDFSNISGLELEDWLG